ncbi:MAG: hypothetical protein PHE96_12260, partial [Methylococcales bacterium]|nr:hypothetical protein [Methylococcales bacterium]
QPTSSSKTKRSGLFKPTNGSITAIDAMAVIASNILGQRQLNRTSLNQTTTATSIPTIAVTSNSLLIDVRPSC